MFSYRTSSLFDSYVKEFRLFADIINDVGLTLDMVAPYVSTDHVLYITSMGTICKVMCGIAAGATKGSITHHFCLRGNMADLNAKEGTQETLVSLIGMLLGIALARYLHILEQTDVSLTAMVSWSIFVILTIVHVWANYKGVKVLRLRTLNRERGTLALERIAEQLAVECTKQKSTQGLEYSADLIPTPEQVSESLWASTRTLIFPNKIRLGVQAKCILDTIDPQSVIVSATEEFGDDRYLLTVGARDNIDVALRVGATDQDELKAFLHAMTLQRCMKQQRMIKSGNGCAELISRCVRPSRQ